MTECTRPTTERTYDVPPDAPAHDCAYCDAVLPNVDLRDLHVGHEHPDSATPAEMDAFDDAFETESRKLFNYHVKVVTAVVVLYFGFLFTYAVAGA